MANLFDGFKSAALKAAENIDVDDIKSKVDAIKDNDKVAILRGAASQTAETIGNRAADIKDAAVAAKEDYDEKRTRLDRMYEESVTEYNDAYTLMNDKGVQLFIERRRAADLIAYVENFVNSIANRPASFDADFEIIHAESRAFTDTCEFADRELQAARQAAGSAGAGLAAGTAVAFMAPTAAMWVATTFGTASTGAAISTLSGAAATNAALAWLGGGALAAGGGGTAAGSALLALAGPVGWGIAGATLLSSIVIYTNKKSKTDKEKSDKITEVKENTEKIKEADVKIGAILQTTTQLRSQLSDTYLACLPLYGQDYTNISTDQKALLGSIVNATKSLSGMFKETVQ